MGRNKAFIDFLGKPLVARVIDQVRAVCPETIIVANDPEPFSQFGLPIVGDVYPGKGSLGGIFTGLQAAREPYVLAVACDMPFLNERLLRYLISLAPGFDAVIPRAPVPLKAFPAPPNATPPRAIKQTARERSLHPLHGVYSKDCLSSIRSRLENGDLRVISFIEAMRVRFVQVNEIDRFDPEHVSFFNVNTPEDLRTALELARDEDK